MPGQTYKIHHEALNFLNAKDQCPILDCCARHSVSDLMHRMHQSLSLNVQIVHQTLCVPPEHVLNGL